MFNFKLVSKIVMTIHVILCTYFIIFSSKMHLPTYLVVYAGISAIIGIAISTYKKTPEKFIKYCPPVLLLGMVTLYGYQMNKVGFIPVLVLAITCLSAMYSEIRVTFSISVYSVFLFILSSKLFPDTVYANGITGNDLYISVLFMVIGQVTIILLILFSNNAINYSKNKTKQIQELLVEVEEKQKEAEAANKTKSDFLANMSHEIRTPMNAICGMVELLIQNGAATGANGEYINTIKIASNSLLGIINDILDFSKIEAGKIETIDINYNFSSSVNDVINIINTKINHEKVAFYVNLNPNIPTLLFGDEIRVKQIMLNLLTNAAKFTNEGFVSLSIDYEIIDSARIKLTMIVNDSGIGIKPEHLDAIFEEFQQVDTRRNRNIQGTGLGLAITKRLCELMDGEISIESSYGVGSTFTATIIQKITDVKPCATVDNPKELNVLLFDSNPYYLSSLNKLFDYLEIKHTSTDDVDEMFVLMNCRNYSHVFFDYDGGIDKINEYLSGEHEDAILVGITGINKYGEKPEVNCDENILIISKPIHFLSIVPILNGQNQVISTNLHSDTTLIAPDAKVLLVDDNIVNLKVTEGLLNSYKISVDTATGGFEAIDMLRNSKEYDMIFMDHMMPQIDGVDTTKIIRNFPEEYYKNVPIIAFTANAVKDAQLMFLENGFNDFLAKPIEIKSLKQILLKWLPEQKQIKSEPLPVMDKIIVSSEFAKMFKKIDVAKGITSCMGDIESYKDILRTFAGTCEKTVTNINECIAKNIYNEFTTYVHAVKSSAKSIGAIKLSEMALNMEEAGKKGDREFIRLYLIDFISEYKAVFREINENVGEAQSQDKLFTGTKIANSDELNSVFGELVRALEDYDSEKAYELLDKCSEYSLDDNFRTVLINAKKFLDEFDYDKASEIIKELLKD